MPYDQIQRRERKSFTREELEERRRLAQEAEERIASLNSHLTKNDDEDSDTDYIQAVAQKHVAKIDMDRPAKQESFHLSKKIQNSLRKTSASIEAIKSDLPQSYLGTERKMFILRI